VNEELLRLLDILVKLLLAAALGGAVGWERESLDRPAGFRTHVLVCVGSAVYMMVSQSFPDRGDPGRIAAQVASGMGFLGAGTILRHGSIVRGLTTAATLWTVAGVGLAVGRGGDMFVIAVLGTLVVLLTLTTLSRVEKKMMTKRQYRLLLMRVEKARVTMPLVQQVLIDRGVNIRSLEVMAAEQPGQEEVRATVRIPPGLSIEQLNNALLQVDGLSFLQWE